MKIDFRKRDKKLLRGEKDLSEQIVSVVYVALISVKKNQIEKIRVSEVLKSLGNG